jgi:molybdopterin-guanine dinucleotide biosynthesis protein A
MSQSPTKVAAFILAGGKSTRMGADKAFVMLNGCTLLERALNLAQSFTSDVTIVGSAAKFHSFAPVVEDIFPNCGPLGGIHAALRASTAELNLILAVDVPFISADLLRYLVARAEGSKALATVPRTSQGWQPLCAIYRREFANAAEAAIVAGHYKITALFGGSKISDVRVCAVAEDEFQPASIPPEAFRNLNTPEELAAVGGVLADSASKARESEVEITHNG